MKKMCFAALIALFASQVLACGGNSLEEQSTGLSFADSTECETADSTERETADSTERETAGSTKENPEKVWENYTRIEDQTFSVELDGWGSVEFLSGYYEDRMTDDLSFFLLKDEKIVYRFPQESFQKGLFDQILAVGFRDVNGDNRKDVIIIYTYETGAGAQGAIPRPCARIYTAGKDVFYLEEALSEEIDGNLKEEDYTIDGICSYILEQKRTDTSEDGRNTTNEAYRAALMNLIDNHIFPDGTQVEWNKAYAMSDNKFAVLDIDQDGSEELLICYEAASMAGMKLGVFEYDASSGKMSTELIEFPAVAFYDNNMATAQASHNHGKSALDDFWPYGLFQYDASADEYIRIAGVDAWQKELEAAEFPAKEDADQNGIVYYLIDDATGEPFEYLDDAEYEAWRDSYLKCADKIQIDWYPLDEENVNKNLKTKG